MIAWLIWTVALASDPQPLRDADLAALSLLAPTESPSGALRYPLDRHAQGRGLVSLYRSPSEAEADIIFDGLSRTAATRWPDWQLAAPSPAARTLGDGQTILLVRVGSDVLLVKDPAARAAELVSQITLLLETR